MALTGGEMLLNNYNNLLLEKSLLHQRNLALLKDKEELFEDNKELTRQLNDLEKSFNELKQEKEDQEKIIKVLLKYQTERNVKNTDIFLFILINLIIVHLFYFFIIYKNNMNITIIKE
jgi:hypothetical protein